jgi:hypothetical protein
VISRLDTGKTIIFFTVQSLLIARTLPEKPHKNTPPFLSYTGNEPHEVMSHMCTRTFRQPGIVQCEMKYYGRARYLKGECREMHIFCKGLNILSVYAQMVFKVFQKLFTILHSY